MKTKQIYFIVDIQDSLVLKTDKYDGVMTEHETSHHICSILSLWTELATCYYTSFFTTMVASHVNIYPPKSV